MASETGSSFDDGDIVIGGGESQRESKAAADQQISWLKTLKCKDLRLLIEIFYDTQKLRIATENRLRSYQQAGASMHDSIKNLAIELKDRENELEKEIKYEVGLHPVWGGWLKDVKGIGPMMAGGLITIIDDIERFATISKLWRYCGLAPNERRKVGEKLRYNPHAKVLAWKIASQFLKARGRYADIYYEAKVRYEGRGDIYEAHHTDIGGGVKGKPQYQALGGPKSYKLHIHQMAMRRMVKRFLADTWVMWRQIEGLPITEPYIFSDAAKQKGIAHQHYVPPANDAAAKGRGGGRQRQKKQK